MPNDRRNFGPGGTYFFTIGFVETETGFVGAQPGAGQRLFVGAPSEAWCFLPGESPGRGRASHPPVSSVAPLAERDRRLMPQYM